MSWSQSLRRTICAVLWMGVVLGWIAAGGCGSDNPPRAATGSGDELPAAGREAEKPEPPPVGRASDALAESSATASSVGPVSVPPLDGASSAAVRPGTPHRSTPQERLASAIRAGGDTPEVRRAAELAEQRYAAAIRLVQDGQLPAALTELEAATKLNSFHVSAWSDWGAVLLELNRVGEAVSVFNEAIAQNADSADLAYGLGVALNRQGKNDASKRALYRALEIDETHLDARKMLGRILLAQGMLMEVSILYERWAELEPDVADAHNDLGVVLVRLGDLRRAEGEFREAIRLDAKHADALYNLGVGLASLGRLDEAIGYYQAAIDADAEYTDAYFNLGRALLRQRKLDEAVEQFEKVIRQDNSYSTAHHLLGKIRLEQGDTKSALRHLTEALRLSPSSVESRYWMGMALLAQGRNRLAIPHFREAVRLKSDYPEAHYRLATTLASQGETAEALAHYQEALELRPDWPEVENNLSWILATHADPAIRDPRQAVSLAQRSVQTLRRKIPLQLDSLAAAHAAGGDFAQAAAVARQAIDAATAAGDEQLAADIRTRLALYEAGQPYIEDATAP